MATFVKDGQEAEFSDEEISLSGGEEAMAKLGITRKHRVGRVSAPATGVPPTGTAAQQSWGTNTPSLKRKFVRNGEVAEFSQEEIDASGGEGALARLGIVPQEQAASAGDLGAIGAAKTAQKFASRVQAGALDTLTGRNDIKRFAEPTRRELEQMETGAVTTAIAGLDGLAKFSGVQTIADVAAAAMAYGGASQGAASVGKMLGVDVSGALNSASSAAAVPIAARGVQAAATGAEALRKVGLSTPGHDAVLKVGQRIGVNPAEDPEAFVNALEKANPGTYAIAELAGGVAGGEASIGTSSATALMAARASEGAPAAQAALSISQAAAKTSWVPEVLRWGTERGLAQGALKGGAAGGSYGFFQGVDDVAKEVIKNPEMTASVLAAKTIHDVGLSTQTGMAFGAAFGVAGEALSGGSSWLQERALSNEGKASSSWAKREATLRSELAGVDEKIAELEAKTAPGNAGRQEKLRLSAYRSTLATQATEAAEGAASPSVNWRGIGKRALVGAAGGEAAGLAVELLTGHGHMGGGGAIGAVAGAARALAGEPMAWSKAQRAVSTTLTAGAALMGAEGVIQRGATSFFSDKVVGGHPSDEDEAYRFFSGMSENDPAMYGLKSADSVKDFVPHWVAGETARVSASIIEYMKSIKPPAPTPDPWTSDPSGVVPVDADAKRAFISGAEAASDPSVVTARITQGLLTREHVAAMEATHPETLSAMREEYLSKMIVLVESGRWKDVGRGQLQQLKVLFGADVDTPQAVRDLQSQFAASKEDDPMGGSSDKTAAAPSRYSGHAADTSKSGSDRVEEGL